MLLFKPEHIPLIQRNEKVESRRLWPKGPRVKPGSYHQIKKTIFTKEHFGYIHILDIRQERLLTITEAGAMAEGGYTRQEYIDLFHDIYPVAGNNPLVWVITFKYTGVKCVEDDGGM